MSKKALVVGVDYVGQTCALNGCASDAYEWAKLLHENGYEVVLMVDDSKPDDASRSEWSGGLSREAPTRSAILKALVEIVVSGARDIFFTFSGHGTQMADQGHEETDGKDEVLCPVDTRSHSDGGGVISDDALRGIWQMMQPHQRVTAVHDCCHSGTGMDLPYQLYERGGQNFRFIREKGEDTPGHVLLLSGCQDDQTSAESTTYNSATGSRESRGALSVASIETLRKYHCRVGAAQLLREVRSLLRERNMSQVAQLSSGRDVSPWASFLN